LIVLELKIAQVFSFDAFLKDPLPFYRVERSFGGFYERRNPTNAHKLIALLSQRNMLLREFTRSKRKKKRLIFGHHLDL
jgi:NAD-dependent SIR2 family protein deacetylase